MNIALDSASEAYALNFLTYGFFTAVNNIWGWIALAFSYWRIEAISPPDTTAIEDKPRAAVEEPVGHTKMKFRAYYEGEGCGEEEEGAAADAVAVEADEEEEEEEEAFDGMRIDDDWRRRMRIGDFSWYTWQDTAMLNGSVVRLWETHGRS
ncbi:hypothetical protein M569_09248 [Genlisea aurea]|uniref:Uncharacterized protein n=1 Tax=Genlisea aurea TaxID=192259 RepID=S8CF31_9LAMI|nr:hypothetical protein M569_09248 [Genlisea aurea]